MKAATGIIAILFTQLTACRAEQPTPSDSVAAAIAETDRCNADARNAVAQLGARMRNVSLLAPDSIARREISSAYGSLVSESLLKAWQANPASAPGREVSNPWPQKIGIRTMQSRSSMCHVEGEVLYVSTDDTTRVVERRTVDIDIDPEQAFQITSYNVSPRAEPSSGRNPTSDVAAVIQRYYESIDSGDLRSAYALWARGGEASGKSFAEFAAGFAGTSDVRVTVGDSIRVEGAAGSQYATIPVSVDATLRSGESQHFAGTYTLRRSMVDGATAEQRTWHIEAAKLRQR